MKYRSRWSFRLWRERICPTVGLKGAADGESSSNGGQEVVVADADADAVSEVALEVTGVLVRSDRQRSAVRSMAWGGGSGAQGKPRTRFWSVISDLRGRSLHMIQCPKNENVFLSLLVKCIQIRLKDVKTNS